MHDKCCIFDSEGMLDDVPLQRRVANSPSSMFAQVGQ
jgi:hypothetical protein